MPRDDGDMNGTVVMNGDVRGSRGRKESTPLLEMDMPVRGKKNAIRKAARSDGASVLTQNANYTVKLLPSTPKELKRPGIEYRGSLSTATGQALAVTHDHAYIWDYTSHTPVGNPRVFDVPFREQHTEPLPFGALVTGSGSTDVGLVMLSATTGRVAFYESIDRASSLSLFQERRSRVEGSLGSFWPGETVVDLISADSAGFIILTSSGRLFQLILRDAQGKARVFAQLLRSSEQASAGWFGSVKGLLGGIASRQDVTAVKVRPLSTRGQMQVIGVSERAEVRFWDVEWNGTYTYRSKVDFREGLESELRDTEAPELQGQAAEVKVLDVAIANQPAAKASNEVATLGAEKPIDLLFLVRTGSPYTPTYALIEASIVGNGTRIHQIRQVTTYHGQSVTQKPRLLLPKPGHTAYIIFGDAVTLVAMSQPQTDGPEAQLHASYMAPETFDDTIHLRSEKDVWLLGACEEDHKSGQATCVAFVESAGLVRFSAADATSDHTLSRIPVKTRIEQAVFKGMLEDNVFDLSRSGGKGYQTHDVEEAALAISDEVLRSEHESLKIGTSSVEAHLARKSEALRALVRHLRQHCPPLAANAMWHLLWDAERVAAAQQMWKTYEMHLAECSKGRRVETLVEEISLWYRDAHPDESVDGSGDEDSVRTMFVKGLSRMDKMFGWGRDFLKAKLNEPDPEPEKMLRLLAEADDLWLSCLQTVFAFRADNALAYGIPPASIEDGILHQTGDYFGIDEPWTATDNMLKAVNWVTIVSRQQSIAVFETTSDNQATAPFVEKIAKANAELVQLYCLIYQERIGWCGSRDSERHRELARKLEANFERMRYEQFRAQAEIAQAEAGMSLAEKYRDMLTLTELVIGEAQYMRESHDESSDEQERLTIKQSMAKVEQRTTSYFERFGDDFATAFFDEGLSSSRAGKLLSDSQGKWTEHLTRYLRADPSRSTICWINDITTAKDYKQAGEALMQAQDSEQKLWSKKVELSMCKLSLLAAAEAQQIPEDYPSLDLPNSGLKIVDIQDQLYKHLLPEIFHCIDHVAEVQVTMDKFGQRTKDLFSLHQLLENYFGKVLDHQALSVEELIDVLTLMDAKWVQQPEEEDEMKGREFHLALKALDAAAQFMTPQKSQALMHLIWKRCMLADDWVTINTGTKKRSDQDRQDTLRATAPFRTLYWALNTRLFDNGYVNALAPSECLGAGCSPEDLRDRFPEADILDPILQDNRKQDEQLQAYITDRRLDSWFQQCADLARNVIQDEADALAEKHRREREFQASSNRNGVNGNGMNGHAKGPNGIKIEDHGEEDGVHSQTEDEDLEMS